MAPMRIRRASLVLLALLTLSVLAGCTGSSDNKNAGPTPAAASSSEAVPSPTEQTPTPTPTLSLSPTETPGSPTAPATPPACDTAHLNLIQGSVEGAAGSTYVTYFLENTGTTTCVLDGYPGVALLRANGSIIQHPADKSGVPSSPVNVAPGKKAQFVLRTSDPGVNTECSYAWKTAQVQVYPPDQTKAIRQPSDIQACNLVVDPVSRP